MPREIYRGIMLPYAAALSVREFNTLIEWFPVWFGDPGTQISKN
jgi:hypothetical protein